MNTLTNNPNHKFRPYFTITELQEIILALKQSPTPTRMGLIKYLEGFILKINHSQISPQHTLAPTLAQKLGFEEPTLLPETITGEAAYQKQIINPSHCTPKEIAAAMDFRYTSGLMSKEEENEYEKACGITF